METLGWLLLWCIPLIAILFLIASFFVVCWASSLVIKKFPHLKWHVWIVCGLILTYWGWNFLSHKKPLKASDFYQYKNSEYDFSLDVPRSWRKSDHPDRGIATVAFFETGTGFNFDRIERSLWIENRVNSNALTFDEFYRYQMDDRKQKFRDIVILEEKDFSNNGYKGKRVVYQPWNEVIIHEVFLSSNNELTWISCWLDPDDDQEYINICETAFNSIVF